MKLMISCIQHSTVVSSIVNSKRVILIHIGFLLLAMSLPTAITQQSTALLTAKVYQILHLMFAVDSAAQVLPIIVSPVELVVVNF